MGPARRGAVIVAAVAISELIGGCSHGGAAGKPGGPVGSGGSTATVVAYDGPAYPGLGAKPAWSRPGSDDAGAVPVGGAFVFATAAATGGDTTGLEFRDAATGRVRTTVQVPARVPVHDGVQAAVWQGKPVVTVRYVEVQKSDGISAEKRTKLVVAYDENGAKVGQAVDTQGVSQDGWVVDKREDQPGSDTSTLRFSPAGGGPAHQLTCPLPQCYIKASAAGPAQLEAGFNFPLTAGELYFTIEQPNGLLGVSRLVALDLASGQKRWTSATAQLPPGAAPEAGVDRLHARPLGTVAGKLLVAWAVGRNDSARVLSLHDPANGRLLATGPRVAYEPDLVAVKDGLAAISAGLSRAGSRALVWDVASGNVLWQQGTDEREFAASGIVNGALYGTTRSTDIQSSGNPVVVDLRTKKVLAKDDKWLLDVPLTAANGYGLVKRNGWYAFPPN
jgi:hypothetical protein